ncbi:MAG: VOC family protein, partial [Bryobacteraceae bacterium]
IADELPFALVFDVHGVMLRVTVVEQLPVAPYTVLGWQVSAVEEAAQALQNKGVEFVRYAQMEQDDLGIWTAPNGTRVA